MGIYRKLFQIVQDQRKALKTAEQVSPLLCIRNMIESGVGKTVEELIPAVVDCTNNGDLCILTCILNSVSNHHVQLLQNSLPTSVFEERVRVVGARGRDKLSKGMMLDALTWKLMKPAVEQYEEKWSFCVKQ